MPAHRLSLTNAAASELVQLVNARGLLTKPVLIRRVSRLTKTHLRALEEPKGDLQAWADRQAVDVEISERERDALKALVTSAAEKGALGCTIGTGELLDLLGLGEEDG